LGSPKLKGGFKVPTLRNIARTAPYHTPAHSPICTAPSSSTNKAEATRCLGMHLYLHWHISDPKLTDTEVDRIVDFLGALTDETFLPQRPAQVPSGMTLPKRGELN
jgi:cytochrome c peroxidase